MTVIIHVFHERMPGFDMVCDVAEYAVHDGYVICVMREIGEWSAWIEYRESAPY